MEHISYNFIEGPSDLTKDTPMAPLKQFVSDSYFFSIIIDYFALINIRQLEYSYCCVVAISISFDFISFAFVQESIFPYFNLYHYNAG